MSSTFIVGLILGLAINAWFILRGAIRFKSEPGLADVIFLQTAGFGAPMPFLALPSALQSIDQLDVQVMMVVGGIATLWAAWYAISDVFKRQTAGQGK